MANGRKTGGRKSGSVNRVTAEVKEALSKCFKTIGGAKAFAEWARGNPTEFYKLWAKMLPKEMELSGKDGKALEPIRVVRVIVPQTVVIAPPAPPPPVPLNGHSAHN